MHDALIDPRTPEICPHCGEHMLGDGYTIPYHCPNAYEELWWYSEPLSEVRVLCPHHCRSNRIHVAQGSVQKCCSRATVCIARSSMKFQVSIVSR